MAVPPGSDRGKLQWRWQRSSEVPPCALLLFSSMGVEGFLDGTKLAVAHSFALP